MESLTLARDDEEIDWIKVEKKLSCIHTMQIWGGYN